MLGRQVMQRTWSFLLRLHDSRSAMARSVIQVSHDFLLCLHCVLSAVLGTRDTERDKEHCVGKLRNKHINIQCHVSQWQGRRRRQITTRIGCKIKPVLAEGAALEDRHGYQRSQPVLSGAVSGKRSRDPRWKLRRLQGSSRSWGMRAAPPSHCDVTRREMHMWSLSVVLTQTAKALESYSVIGWCHRSFLPEEPIRGLDLSYPPQTFWNESGARI